MAIKCFANQSHTFALGSYEGLFDIAWKHRRYSEAKEILDKEEALIKSAKPSDDPMFSGHTKAVQDRKKLLDDNKAHVEQ